jgi:hypothetical protein
MTTGFASMQVGAGALRRNPKNACYQAQERRTRRY